ncbi:MAG: C40 family peptidase [Fimbriimonadaceae bacterium]|nr:C40 family peptidase [Chitinophagales bacterium]
MRFLLFLLIVIFSQLKSLAQNPDPWWISNPYIDSASLRRQILADSILNYAYTFKGVPYVWGGNSPESGFDCSGFIYYVYKKFGIELPRTSGQQFDAGIPIPYTEAERGDIILFTGMHPVFGIPGHVGIIISRDDEGFTFIHTASPLTGGVHVSHSKERSFYERFLEVRRVIRT